MTHNDDAETGFDSIALDRRTALKSGAAGLGLLALGGLGSGSAAADHSPANKVAAAGTTMKRLSSPAGSQDSPVETLLEVSNVKTSSSDQDSLVFQPTVESSLFTRVVSDGGGGGGNGKDKDKDTNDGWESIAKAGVLGWIEIRGDATGGDWRMVSIDGHIDQEQQPPQRLGDLVGTDGNIHELADCVVGFDTRELYLEWDIQDLLDAVEELQDEVYDDDGTYTEEIEVLLDLYMRTRSANGFNWIARGVNGVNDLRLQGALYDFTDGDAEAEAVVGNRTMVIRPEKLPHDVA